MRKYRWIIVLLLAAVLVWRLYDRFTPGGTPDTEFAAPELHTVEVTNVVSYADMTALTYRVRTTRDVLPGGLSAAMAPALVAWDSSSVAPGGEILIRNVNHGGNPVTGVTVLRTAVVRPDRIVRAEFIMVPLGGPEAISHGQIRFVFEDGGAEFLGTTPGTVGEPDPLTDLVLSWEAWRPPGVDYKVLRGMDPDVYQLTMRAYSGPQRFLEDALMKRDWRVYTLQLPGDREGLSELLRVSLAMGDGAARDVIARFLDHADGEWAASGPDSETEGGDADTLWRAIRHRLGGARADGDERIDMSGRSGYHSLLRSCATMALYMVDVTTARLIETGHEAGTMRPTQKPELEDEPEWMREMADASIAGVFLRGPRMISFVRSYPTAIPGRIPGALDDAGLLVRRDGKALRRDYSINSFTPWGPRDHLLIR
jgi:hypothetical protein